MHLWPSVRLRDSFKIAYLRKLEWNLHRMKLEKQSSSSPKTPNNQQNLLNDQEPVESNSASSECCASFTAICREIFMVLSCCYCCFCCGAKMAGLRQAKEEAEKEIAEYHAQVEYEFQKKSSGDSGENVKRLEIETDAKINHLKNEAARISHDVVRMLLKNMTTVRN
ncbi:uncharacterized protein LOC120153955 isoform X2 [Hibiscus syriacus]|uniref:uncharacterized protein LOC120153955 isoform X2 n=1 Tax=Hibiscus syriacus TaxID=106335 RepID=UPI0019226D61|nr:uncharacterized protein LOC120153955 isoform X2 [Hibiscus syriacus]